MKSTTILKSARVLGLAAAISLLAFTDPPAAAQTCSGALQQMTVSTNAVKWGNKSPCESDPWYLVQVTYDAFGLITTNQNDPSSSQTASAWTTGTSTYDLSGNHNVIWTGQSQVGTNGLPGSECSSTLNSTNTDLNAGDFTDTGICYQNAWSMVSPHLPPSTNWCVSTTNLANNAVTNVSWTISYFYYIDGTGNSITAYKTNIVTSSVLFTDSSLVDVVEQRLPPFPADVTTNWSPGTGTASWNEELSGLDPATAQETRYQVGVPNPQTNTTYLLTWYEVTMNPTNLAFKVIPHQESIQGNGTNGTQWGGIHTIAVPAPTNCNITTTYPTLASADPGQTVPPGNAGGGGGGLGGGCGTCGGGAGFYSYRQGPVHQISMGAAAFGQSAGNLVFGSLQTNLAVFSPAGLSYDSSPPDVVVVTNAGAIRQVYAPQALADIPPPPTTNGYVINFYYPADVFTNTLNGLYEVNSNAAYFNGPFATWVITNLSVDGSAYRVTQMASSSIVNQWTDSYSAGAWSVQPQGGALQRNSSISMGVGTFSVADTYQAPGSSLVYQVTNVYTFYPGWGWGITSSSVGSGTNLQVTSYTYNNSIVSSNGAASIPLASATYPDGSCNSYSSYDTNGNPTGVNSSLGDAPSGRVAGYNYNPSDPSVGVSALGDNGTLFINVPRLTTESVSGTEVSRQFTAFPAAGTRIDIQCTATSVGWNASGNLFTTNLFYTNGPNATAPQAVIRPDNTATFYNYLFSADGNYKTNISATGQPDAAYTHIIDGVSNITVVNLAGKPVIQASYDVITGIVLSQDVYGNFDGFLRPGLVTHLDSTTEQTYFGCCGVSSTVDRDGVITEYLYDAANRPSGYARIFSDNSMITYTNVLDAAGRTLQTIRIGTNGSSIITYQAQYDQAGNLLYETNALGGVTSHTRSNNPSTGGLILATVNPDSGTQTNAYYADGTLKSTTGTAVHGAGYQYGVGSSASVGSCLLTTRTNLNPNGTPTSEYTTTYTDPAGRPCETYYADGAYSQSFYNSLGQLSDQVDPDGVATLYAYNAKGERLDTAVDMNQNGQIDYAGPDRITRVVTTNDLTSLLGLSGNVQRTLTYVWTNASSAPLCLFTNETTTDGLRSAGLTPAGLSQSSTVYGANGLRTVTGSAPDGSYTVIVYQNARLASATRYNPAGGQISGTTYSYDAHGRQNTVTDARNGTTTLVYNNADLVATNTSPAPGTPGGAQPVTANLYNQMLQATNVVLPDGGVVSSSYFLTGEPRQTAGARTYPVAYTYDYAGRMATMTTWTNFAGNQGMAVTTWNYSPTRGWLVSKQYAITNGPTYAYTAAGRLASRTWARGVVTTYAYDTAGTLTNLTYSSDPQGTPPVGYACDRLGRQTRVAVGGVLYATNGYNNANQMLSETYFSGPLAGLSVTNGYDQCLRRTALVALNGATAILNDSFSYDTASRLQTVTDNAGNLVTYSYLANSPLVGQILFANGGQTRMTTTKQYDFLNRLNQISSVPLAAPQPGGGGSPAVTFTYQYNFANQRTAVTNADGSFWAYSYDALGQVTNGNKFWSDTTPVAGEQFTYAFDTIGNRTGTGAGGDSSGAGLRPASYHANVLNQYTSRDVPGAFDVLGLALATNTTLAVNGQTPYRKAEFFRQQLSVTNTNSAVWQSVTVTATNVATVTGNVFLAQTPEQVSYDADGNLLSDGHWNYTWDAENRLIGMTNNAPAAPAQVLAFGYDWRGRRVQKQVWCNGVLTNSTAFLYDGWNLAARLNATNGSVLQSYLWGLDLSGSQQGAGGVGGLLAVHDAVSGLQFAAFDGNDNVAALTSATTGTNSAQYEYGPFGELIRATGTMAKANPFRFSTKYQDDETELVYYGYRYYSPDTGRWLSRDPANEKGGDNLYSLLDNCPASSTDFLGLNVYKIIEVNKDDVLSGFAHHRKIYGDDGKGGWYCIEVLGTRCCWGGIGPSKFKYIHGSGSATNAIAQIEFQNGGGGVGPLSGTTQVIAWLKTSANVDALLNQYASGLPAGTWLYIFWEHDCGTFANDFLLTALLWEASSGTNNVPMPDVPPYIGGP